MTLLELLPKYRYTLKGETQLWEFLEYVNDYDKPFVMRRVEDNQLAYFDLSDIVVSEPKISSVENDALKEQIKTLEKHLKSADEHRLHEYNQVRDRLETSTKEIDMIVKNFDEMSINLIKQLLSSISETNKSIND